MPEFDVDAPSMSMVLMLIELARRVDYPSEAPYEGDADSAQTRYCKRLVTGPDVSALSCPFVPSS